MKDYRNLTEHRLDLLTLVGTFGYLTTREIALLAYPNAPPKPALKSAQAVCEELRADKLLLVRKLAVNGVTYAYVLTGRAAEILNAAHSTSAFSDGYGLATAQQILREPVIRLAHVWRRDVGLGAVGARGLESGAFELGSFKGLDALLVDPFGQTPAFGIMLVRTFDEQTIRRLRRLCLLSVPILLAGNERDRHRIESLAKIRAIAAPWNEQHIQTNQPAGVLC